MRIVQTFWTAGRNPLKHSFGWVHPEYNLMSWTLSCLCLRKYYDEVALYTDKMGKYVLIDLLHLPYTEVNVIYDETLCLPQHWAYSKIKTYSLQTKPFLHVDGDVFLSKPIKDDVINAPLIAQNREIGTTYYRQMMDRIIEESAIVLPQYIEDCLKEEYIVSYNMGIFGGSNLTFIREYCEEAKRICETNKALCLNGNFNLLFEQILFAYKVEKDRLLVNTIFSKTYNDNGYSIADFCLLNSFKEKNYFHILGGHKRNHDITDSLEETLLILYPDSYKLIASIFPHRYPRGGIKGTLCIPIMLDDEPIKAYIEFLNKAEKDWSAFSWEELLDVELRCIDGKTLSYHKDRLNEQLSVCENPYLKCFNVPTSWNEETIQKIRKRFSHKKNVPIQKVAVIPTLSSKHRKEYVLFDLESQVLELLRKHPMQMSDLLNELISKGKSEEKHSLWMMEISILLNEGLLIPYYQTKF